MSRSFAIADAASGSISSVFRRTTYSFSSTFPFSFKSLISASKSGVPRLKASRSVSNAANVSLSARYCSPSFSSSRVSVATRSSFFFLAAASSSCFFLARASSSASLSSAGGGGGGGGAGSFS